MPDYDKSDNDTVVLTLPGTVIDENYSLLLLENSDIDLATTVLLDKVQKGKSIGDEAIKMLRKKGLIEGRKPHLYVSKQIAKATNTQVEYTLKKGFNDAECQEWIMKALNDHSKNFILNLLKPTCLHKNGDKHNVYRCFRHLSAYIKPT